MCVCEREREMEREWWKNREEAGLSRGRQMAFTVTEDRERDGKCKREREAVTKREMKRERRITDLLLVSGPGDRGAG